MTSDASRYIYDRTVVYCHGNPYQELNSCPNCPPNPGNTLFNCTGQLTKLKIQQITWTGNFDVPERIYPFTPSPNFDQLSPSWASRREVFRIVQETDGPQVPYNGIFSLSIVPYESQIQPQPIAYRFTCQPNVNRISLEGELAHRSVSSCSLQDTRMAPFKTGFLKPFEHFNSPLFFPDPCLNARSIKMLNGEEIQPEISELSPKLQKRVETIARLFLSDEHAKQLCLTVTQPDCRPEKQVQKLLFQKKTD